MSKKTDMNDVINILLDKMSSGTCLYATAERGTCAEVCGDPIVEYNDYEKAVKPEKWCNACWNNYLIQKLKQQVKELKIELKLIANIPQVKDTCSCQ